MKTITGNPDFTYEIACTEVCGPGHFGMRMKMVVDDEDEFAAWFKSQESFLAKNPDYLRAVPEKLKAEAKKSVEENKKSIGLVLLENSSGMFAKSN
jgi:cytochrome c oxidase subunit 2